MTDLPAAMRLRAAVRPESPPPMMTTSAVRVAAEAEEAVDTAVSAAPAVRAEVPRTRRRLRDVGAAGVVLIAPALLLVLPYRAVQAEMGLRRSLAAWAVLPIESFGASPAFLARLWRRGGDVVPDRPPKAVPVMREV